MLETLVAPRIRRALFEYLLTHPDDRFYLRGLAKSLGLSVSPLRRELKRLEHAGILTAAQEGNILFYSVNTASQAFLQLQHAGQPTEAPSVSLEAQGSRLEAGTSSLQPRALSPEPIPIGVISASSTRSRWSKALKDPAFLGLSVMGLAVVLLTGELAYLIAITHQQWGSQMSQMLVTRKAEVTVVAPSSSSSGTMRGARWQVVPGGFGGFSSGASNESH